MPIYEFRCETCGSAFEALVGSEEDASCPGCGGRRARRVYSPQAPPFRLVKRGGEARSQERRNEVLRKGAKERFKRARKRSRQRAKGTADGDR